MAAEERPRRRSRGRRPKKNALLADARSDTSSDNKSDAGSVSTTNSNPKSEPACPAIFDECKQKNLCYRFQRGTCTLGDNCKYKHEHCTTPKPAGFIKERRGQGKGRGKGKSKRGGSPPRKPDTRSPEEKAKVPCRHHLAGNCTKGDQCPYKH